MWGWNRFPTPKKKHELKAYFPHSLTTCGRKQQILVTRNGLWGPIPASQCALLSATLAAQWWAEPSLFPPSVVRGLEPRSARASRRGRWPGNWATARARCAPEPSRATWHVHPQEHPFISASRPVRRALLTPYTNPRVTLQTNKKACGHGRRESGLTSAPDHVPQKTAYFGNKESALYIYRRSGLVV